MSEGACPKCGQPMSDWDKTALAPNHTLAMASSTFTVSGGETRTWYCSACPYREERRA